MARPSLLPFLIGMIICSISSAVAFDETLEVHSRTLANNQFLRGEADAGTPVTLDGDLSGPDGKEELPVVILLHGGDGPKSGAVWNWSRTLNKAGIATFSLDSYSGRGLSGPPADRSLDFTQIYDTYRAVEALAAHPKIDGSRVAVMGFSLGGITALYSAMARFHKSFGPKEGKIVAYLPFYPYCNFGLADELNIVSEPIREFHGADDDRTPAPPCRAYIDRLADAGHDAQMTIYPGALHSFDDPRNPAFYSESHWRTSRNCQLREENGQLLNAATGKPFTDTDACVEYGGSVQYNDAAATAAQTAVVAFLSELFADN
jgi:dienelactone hydrolase